MRLFALLCLLLSSVAFAQTPTISQQDLLINQMSGTAYQIIDVRSEQEYAAGHIKGALNIPFDQIDAHDDLLTKLKNKTLVVYCRSGRRAGIFEKALREQGFNLLHLVGDMNAWQKQQLPIVK